MSDSPCYASAGPTVAGGGVSGLVTGAVLKTVEAEALDLAGSIPVRLREADTSTAAQTTAEVRRSPAEES